MSTNRIIICRSQTFVHEPIWKLQKMITHWSMVVMILTRWRVWSHDVKLAKKQIRRNALDIFVWIGGRCLFTSFVNLFFLSKHLRIDSSQGGTKTYIFIFSAAIIFLEVSILSKWIKSDYLHLFLVIQKNQSMSSPPSIKYIARMMQLFLLAVYQS